MTANRRFRRIADMKRLSAPNYAFEVPPLELFLFHSILTRAWLRLCQRRGDLPSAINEELGHWANGPVFQSDESVCLAAQPAAEPHAPGLGEFITATQLHHAKLWFVGQAKNWDLAGYEIDEIKEGLEDAAKQFPAHDGLPVADMIKSHTHAPLDELEKAVDAKSSAKRRSKKPFIKIQGPTAAPLTNQVFRP